MRRQSEIRDLSAAGTRPNPFPGLRPFEPEEDHLFFGREQQVDELLRRLRRARFLAVLGTSGSGKSSLVKSGLIPALYGGFMARAGSSWRVAVMRPGNDPIGGLASALGAPGVLGEADQGPTESDAAASAQADIRRELLLASLSSSGKGLVRCVEEARLPPQENTLVVVDQFEELFRFKDSRGERSGDQASAFVKLLQEAARQSAVPIYVVLTMRAGFVGQCMEFPQLPEDVNAGVYLVPRMTRDELRRAITGPVAVGSAQIAPRLVTRLLNDVGEDPDQLPILQHALMRMWDHWAAHCTADEPIDVEDYEGIGTMAEAMSRHAEGAFAELESPSLQAVAEKVFKALTMKDAENRGIRRPCRFDDLCDLAAAAPDEVAAVIEVFRRPGRAFLMPPAEVEFAGDSILDISHESLMRLWQRLIDWVEEEAESARFYRRLSRVAGFYAAGEGGLWHEEELQVARRWREKTRPSEAWGRRYDADYERAMGFLEESERAWEEEQASLEAARARELKRTRLLAAVLGYAALATVALGLWAWREKNQVEEKLVVVEEKLVVVEKEKEDVVKEKEGVEKEMNEAVEKLSRLQGLSEEELAEAQRQYRKAEAERLRAERMAAEARARAAAARGDAGRAGREARDLLAEAEALRRRAQADVALAQRQRMRAMARVLALESRAADSPELALLLAVEAQRMHSSHGGEPQSLEVYAALRQALERMSPGSATRLLAGDRVARALAVATDGRTLAAGGDDGVVRFSGLEGEGSSAPPPVRLGGRIRALAFSSPRDGGARLAAGGSDGSLRLIEGDSPPRLVAGLGGSVNALAFRPGTAMLAGGGSDGSVRLWDLAADDRETTLRAGGPPAADGEVPGRILSLAWSPDGESLAAASGDEGVFLWRRDFAPGAERRLASHRETRSVAFSRGGRLAVGLLDGRIALWQVDRLERGADVKFFGHLQDVTALAFHPELEILASAGYDGSIRLWDLRHGDAPPVELPGHGFSVQGLAFAGGGDRLVSAGADRRLRVHTTGTEALAAAACQRLGRNLTCDEWAEYLAPGVSYVKSCPQLAGGGCPALPPAER